MCALRQGSCCLLLRRSVTTRSSAMGKRPRSQCHHVVDAQTWSRARRLRAASLCGEPRCRGNHCRSFGHNGRGLSHDWRHPTNGDGQSSPWQRGYQRCATFARFDSAPHLWLETPVYPQRGFAATEDVVGPALRLAGPINLASGALALPRRGRCHANPSACCSLRLAAAAPLALHLVPPAAEESSILPLALAVRSALTNATAALPH